MSALNRQVGVYLIDGTTKLEESVYNAAGERAAMVSYQGGAATGFTKYLREGAAVVYEKSFTVSGGAHSSNSEKTYLYASGRMAVTKAKNLQSGAATYSYYGIDHLGTVRFSRTVDSNGAVVQNGDASYAYEPFGVVIPGANPAPDPSGNTHLYTGHERDALPDGTNIDYMHFRFYGASIGRFQKPDSNFDSPIANPQGWNLYSYVKGNPVNFNDPTGHDTGIPWRVQGAVSGGGTAAPGKQVLQADAFGGGLSIGGTPWDDAFSSMYGEMYKTSGQAANQPAQPAAQTPAPAFGGKYSLNTDPLGVGAQLAEDVGTLETRNHRGGGGGAGHEESIGFSFKKKEVIPSDVASQCTIIGHGGLWKYRGVQQTGLAWGKEDVSLEREVWELRAVTDVFNYKGATGVAIPVQYFSQPGDGPLYYESPASTPHDLLNPFNCPIMGLGQERDLGNPLPLNSTFWEWRQ